MPASNTHAQRHAHYLDKIRNSTKQAHNFTRTLQPTSPRQPHFSSTAYRPTTQPLNTSEMHFFALRTHLRSCLPITNAHAPVRQVNPNSHEISKPSKYTLPPTIRTIPSLWPPTPSNNSTKQDTTRPTDTYTAHGNSEMLDMLICKV